MKIIQGYVGKADYEKALKVNPNEENYKDGYLRLMLFEEIGDEDDYSELDWPPKKIKITIEEV